MRDIDDDAHASPATETIEWVAPAAPRSRQVDGDHYSRHRIQPWDIIDEYGLDYYAGSALKYLLRRKPGVARITDLRKAAHYLEQCIEREAGA